MFDLPIEQSGACNAAAALGGHVHGSSDGGDAADNAAGQSYGGIDVSACGARGNKIRISGLIIKYLTRKEKLPMLQVAYAQKKGKPVKVNAYHRVYAIIN